MQDFIKSNVHYGETGTRDEWLAMENVVLGERKGHLHFIRFSTDVVGKFLLLAKELNASVLNNKVCATGGGAFKFEEEFQEVCLYFLLNMTLTYRGGHGGLRCCGVANFFTRCCGE